MLSTGRIPSLLLLAVVAVVCAEAGQQPEASSNQMLEAGQVTVSGRVAEYRIHRLPVSSFPDLPGTVAAQLERRGCMIPQTYEAHHPENVVHASLERAGSSDWAVLCSARGAVSLLVFFGSTPAKPAELAQAPEIKRLQRHDSSGVYGFNWGIDSADAEKIHEAQSGPDRTPLMDHDGLADSVIEHGTRYHVYSQHAWAVIIPDS